MDTTQQVGREGKRRDGGRKRKEQRGKYVDVSLDAHV
jgi:hypothetical protein